MVERKEKKRNDTVPPPPPPPFLPSRPPFIIPNTTTMYSIKMESTKNSFRCLLTPKKGRKKGKKGQHQEAFEDVIICFLISLFLSFLSFSSSLNTNQSSLFCFCSSSWSISDAFFLNFSILTLSSTLEKRHRLQNTF